MKQLNASTVQRNARLTAAGWDVSSRRRGERTWWRADKGDRACWWSTLAGLERLCNEIDSGKEASPP